MTAAEIREGFLKYYEGKEHFRMPSSSLIPKDPQLLFTIAGMVQFKPIFWGKVKPVHKRVTTCQKCVRTNDIDEVGKTKRHHTFFEMLGNFSFGDYFKEDAIKWAWEFSTVELEMPQERLWVSVYEEDEEAYNIWRDVIAFPEEKIIIGAPQVPRALVVRVRKSFMIPGKTTIVPIRTTAPLNAIAGDF